MEAEAELVNVLVVPAKVKVSTSVSIWAVVKVTGWAKIVKVSADWAKELAVVVSVIVLWGESWTVTVFEINVSVVVAEIVSGIRKEKKRKKKVSGRLRVDRKS